MEKMSFAITYHEINIHTRLNWAFTVFQVVAISRAKALKKFPTSYNCHPQQPSTSGAPLFATLQKPAKARVRRPSGHTMAIMAFHCMAIMAFHLSTNEEEAFFNTNS
jgi:hypothetical protein